MWGFVRCMGYFLNWKDHVDKAIQFPHVYIFNLCSEILLSLFKNNIKKIIIIKRIKIGNVDYLFTQFSDDTTVMSDGIETHIYSSLNTLTYTVIIYEK